MKLSDMYSYLPPILQNVAVSIYGFRRNQRRYGGDFKDRLQETLCNDRATKEELVEIQKTKLRELLIVASKTPYYKELFQDIEIDITKDNPFAILKKLPLLEKASLRGHERLFYINKRVSDQEFHTSGSTGTPICIHMNISDFRDRMAILEKLKLRFGVYNKAKHITFVGKMITSRCGRSFWRYNIPGSQMVMSVYDLNEANREKYVQVIKRYDPVLVEGYPSALSIVAKWLSDDAADLNVRCVFVTGETLSDEQKSCIERGFHCPVVNYYGSTDGSVLITQCECGNLHLEHESGILELLREDGTEADADEPAEMIVTCFNTKSTPLIRYRIGDMATYSQIDCPCGRQSLVIKEIIGRTDDVFFTPDKGNVGRLSTSLKLLPWYVSHSQIQQNGEREFSLLLESKKELGASEKKIVLDDLRKKLGNVNIQVNYVEKIPVGKNGKFRSQIKIG